MSKHRLSERMSKVAARFGEDREGANAIAFGMTALPVMLLVGSAVDYSMAASRKASLQGAVDAAVLAAVLSPSAERERIVAGALTASLDAKLLEGLQYSVADTSQGALVNARAVSATGVMTFAGVTQIVLNATASARALRRDPSCILTLARDIPVGEAALQFNGSPNISLTGCGLMSNASVSCSGFSTNAPYTAAVGVVMGNCPNQKPGHEPVPDIYEALKANIQLVCNGARGATTWRAGAALPLPAMIPVTRSTHLEYHVCGDLRVDGVGALNTAAGGRDVVIVIENGDLDLRADADASSARMTFVLTGADGAASHRVNFPEGVGQRAKLAVSPSVNVQNPWRGVSIYQDPRLTRNIDMVWSPAAFLSADGVIYFGRASLTMNGNASSNLAMCTKFVTNRFTSNGAVDFRFGQDGQSCRDLSVAQWESPPHLIR